MKRAELISKIREVSISGKTYEEYLVAVASRLYIESARPIGYWEEENKRPRSSQFRCSVCGGLAYFPQPTRDESWQKCCPYKYCPNCGASMKGIENEQK